LLPAVSEETTHGSLKQKVCEAVTQTDIAFEDIKAEVIPE